MTLDTRPLRSVLYVPATHARAMEKARGLNADVVVLDLEDAVLPDQKTAARDAVRVALTQGGFGASLVLVRVNGQDTPWGKDDIATLARAELDGIVLPKVNRRRDIEAVASACDHPLWAMIETPLGVLKAGQIAGHGRVAGLIVGTNDLSADLKCTPSADRLALRTSLQMVVVAARARGAVCIDGVFNAFQDSAGFQAECEQGRGFGFDGKSVIHPSQIALANSVFAPTQAELDLAQRQIDAFAQAEQAGQAIAVLDGHIVENLHVAAARALLARHSQIQQQES